MCSAPFRDAVRLAETSLSAMRPCRAGPFRREWQNGHQSCPGPFAVTHRPACALPLLARSC
jgi:hypothetical protein